MFVFYILGTWVFADTTLANPNDLLDNVCCVIESKENRANFFMFSLSTSIGW